MRGALPPLPQYAFVAWCSIKKHRANFTFTFYNAYSFALYTEWVTNPLRRIIHTVLYEYNKDTVREGHRLRVFENRVLRRIFGPKREEVAGGWR
jgi:hypothetical protein